MIARMLFNRALEGDTGPASYIETEGADGKLINPGEWSDDTMQYEGVSEPIRVLTLELLGPRERAVIAACRLYQAAHDSLGVTYTGTAGRALRAALRDLDQR